MGSEMCIRDRPEPPVVREQVAQLARVAPPQPAESLARAARQLLEERLPAGHVQRSAAVALPAEHSHLRVVPIPAERQPAVDLARVAQAPVEE